ncbi:MAG: GNAT family N-acetyltransferase [Chloroflexota bacterium]|nr:GNAT family N-acetyltransferase [Chloroflexota bacterium]
MGITIRNYRPDDVERIVALINAADAIDQTEDGTSVAETREWFASPGFNPEENVFVAEDDGQMIGYALVRLVKNETESTFRTWYQVHPTRRGGGLEDRLLARQYARAEERLIECASAVVNFDAQTSITERERIAILERFGLREVRRFWLMVRSLQDALPAPQFPSGIVTRSYRTQQDDAAMHAADAEIFRDHWGHSDMPLKQWQHYVGWEAFKPDLTVIAQDAATREVAGFCTITLNAEENARLGIRRGWIDILGVRRPYRKRGLATALLLAGLHNLSNAGAQQAALGCDSENLTGATRIYERVGFRVEKTRATYRKQMRDASAARARASAQVTGQ